MFFLQLLEKISRSSLDEKTIMVITAVVILALVVDMEQNKRPSHQKWQLGQRLS